MMRDLTPDQCKLKYCYKCDTTFIEDGYEVPANARGRVERIAPRFAFSRYHKGAYGLNYECKECSARGNRTRYRQANPLRKK